ncbi:NRDE family protein [Siminovitchia sediminis]|uniref:NRDE family protein n=1 Tax=Siminovitchia sediminis TaxID=1274353 RepID=A0ABW4KDT7_9BACI
MCIIFAAYRSHPDYELIIAANRDEFYRRPSKAAHFWDDEPNILAGRDLKQMGTWMGITKSGRFAALTNYRSPAEFQKPYKRSRGQIVKDFLAGNEAPIEFLKRLQHKKEEYRGFNILVGDQKELYYYSNIGNQIQKLQAGIYGLSNDQLDTPWPKAEKGKQHLQQLLNRSNWNCEDLFKLLADHDPAPSDKLPQTGIPVELEKMLSSIFIQSPDYGTRCSTVLLIDREHEVHFVERTFDGGTIQDQAFRFRLTAEEAST